MTKIAVIDDEKYSRVELIHQIRQCLSDADIREAASGAQAMQLLEKESFDYLFIDIRLGDMEGTTVASLARRLMPKSQIIFATAFSEYAVTAFELKVNDYILKPYDPRRIRQILLQDDPQQAQKNAPSWEAERLAISSNRHTILLDVDQVTYVETNGSGKGCVVHTLSGGCYGDNQTLSAYEQRLHLKGFYRTHKTCLVNLNHVQDIFPWSNSSFALRVRGSDAVLPIGRDKIRGLREYLHI